MAYDYTTDPRMLAAGNARGLPGGDPDAMEVSPTAGAVAGSTGLTADHPTLTQAYLADLKRERP